MYQLYSGFSCEEWTFVWILCEKKKLKKTWITWINRRNLPECNADLCYFQPSMGDTFVCFTLPFIHSFIRRSSGGFLSGEPILLVADRSHCVLWISWVSDINSGWLFRNLGTNSSRDKFLAYPPFWQASVSRWISKFLALPSRAVSTAAYTGGSEGASLIGRRLRKCDSDWRRGGRKFPHRYISGWLTKVF